MRHDILDQFSVDQVVTTTAAVSTNSKFKKEASQDLGIGSDPQMGLVFAPAADGVGATSWTIELIEADDAALTTNVLSLGSMSIPFAKMKNGQSFFLPLAPGVMTKSYYGARYTPVGGGGQTLTINSYFGTSDDIANYKSFKSNYVVAN